MWEVRHNRWRNLELRILEKPRKSMNIESVPTRAQGRFNAQRLLFYVQRRSQGKVTAIIHSCWLFGGDSKQKLPLTAQILHPNVGS